MDNNPLLCDPDSGVCIMPNASDTSSEHEWSSNQQAPIQIVYFTDPICSSCWGIEPQLRKLKLEYGNSIHIEYRMGGLLPDWSYNSGGISQPSDVASHWDEVSHHYDMPIDGDVWLEDPLESSYPPSIAFKAAQIQSEAKALLFLREIREMVFLQKKNICKWEHLKMAATKFNLDTNQMKTDMDGKANDLFKEDLILGKALGVRGFPTLFFRDTNGKAQTVYGSRPYETYENTLKLLMPNIIKQEVNNSFDALFTKFGSLTLREFAELSGMERSDAEKMLNEKTILGVLKKYDTKNGAIWIKK
jgi:predicted DsbA family dithiol-disulfide isomerase